MRRRVARSRTAAEITEEILFCNGVLARVPPGSKNKNKQSFFFLSLPAATLQGFLAVEIAPLGRPERSRNHWTVTLRSRSRKMSAGNDGGQRKTAEPGLLGAGKQQLRAFRSKLYKGKDVEQRKRYHLDYERKAHRDLILEETEVPFVVSYGQRRFRGFQTTQISLRDYR
ncbi:hypothetical protein L596_007323 [Steinernema carpocapsae]|uniref:Uncharacterized protein n=1 Tax=Steinernema carpocapsae TaxID=34508 RepID=A0A4U5P915_STECR|nr:hypothetical protein L596_007323 [Steinernema carpocapsae]